MVYSLTIGTFNHVVDYYFPYCACSHGYNLQAILHTGCLNMCVRACLTKERVFDQQILASFIVLLLIQRKVVLIFCEPRLVHLSLILVAFIKPKNRLDVQQVVIYSFLKVYKNLQLKSHLYWQQSISIITTGILYFNSNNKHGNIIGTY